MGVRRKYKRFRKGKGIEADVLNQMQEGIERMASISGDGKHILVSNTTHGVGIRFVGKVASGGGAEPPRPFRVKAIANDYLTCRTWDGTTDGDVDVLVARPFLLRHVLANYPWITGFTTVDAQQADVVESGDTYRWKVTLPYAVNEVIWAQRTTLGDVTVSDEPLVWEDTNRAGHAWGVVE